MYTKRQIRATHQATNSSPFLRRNGRLGNATVGNVAQTGITHQASYIMSFATDTASRQAHITDFGLIRTAKQSAHGFKPTVFNHLMQSENSKTLSIKAASEITENRVHRAMVSSDDRLADGNPFYWSFVRTTCKTDVCRKDITSVTARALIGLLRQQCQLL